MPKHCDLPPSVAQFLEAANLGEIDDLLSAFVEDAIVNDQLCEYCGLDEIHRWAREELIGKHLKIDVVEARRHYGQMIMTAEIDGDFDKRGLPNPLVLNFYIAQDGGKLVQLIVLPKLPRE